VSDVFLASRLQNAIGDAYRLERELPGGGMSRLFVAVEASLNRRVVIKVLPPELTSDVSAQRFKQEIELAAHLQHPHILPILAAGSKDDLLYYVMPYVSGESLRQHLEQGGPMPIGDAVRILREVADALAHAHRKGIVHRDIKPENILLEEGHAVLADFGVARAIDEARSGQAMPRVTGTGMSVGTPTYMAPEQASGERHIDARADLYALAIVGYEMLAGKLPFSAPSAQAMLAAHLTTPPPPLAKSRPDVPSPVSAAIAKALAKAPDDRYRTAEEFRDALDPAAGAAGAGGGGGRRRSVAIAAAAALVLAAGALIATWRSRPALQADLLAVAPFDVLDPELKLWHEGMVDVLSRNLDGAGELRTVAPSVVIRKWSGRADRASAEELGRATGARYAVFGSLVRAGDSVKATVSVVDVRTGRDLGPEISRQDVPGRMDRLADSITFSLVSQLQPGSQRTASLGTSSLPALKAYLQGEQFYRRTAWDSAVVWYRRAVDADSGFALASAALGTAYGWVGGSGDTLSDFYFLLAGRHNHGLAVRDSLIILGDSLEAALTQPQFDPLDYQHRVRLFRAMEDLTRRYPDDPAGWYALGDARFHFAQGRRVGVPVEQVMAAFDRAIALDSTFTPSYVHAIALAYGLGGREAGGRYAAAYFAQHPRGVDSAGIALAARLADPALASASETARMMAAASNDVLVRASNALVAWSDSAETVVRVERQLSPARPTTFTRYGDTAWQRRRLSRAVTLRGHWQEGMDMAGRAPWDFAGAAMLGAFPADSVWHEFERQVRRDNDSCPMCFYNYWAERGDTASLQRGARMFDDAMRRVPDKWAQQSLPFLTALERAYLLLARHDSAAALAAFIALPDSLCYQCGFYALTQAELLHAAKRDREALGVLNTVGTDLSVGAIAMTLERGRVAEQLGEKEIAVDSYLRVAGMWQNGDAFLQPYVKEAREGLKRLGGEHAKGIPLGATPASR